MMCVGIVYFHLFFQKPEWLYLSEVIYQKTYLSCYQDTPKYSQRVFSLIAEYEFTFVWVYDYLSLLFNGNWVICKLKHPMDIS